MHNNYEILELFPTPVYVTKLPEELGKIVPWLLQQEIRKDKIDSSNYGERSINSYILHEPDASDLSTYLLAHLKEFSSKLGYQDTDFKFSQSWISYKQPGQHHTLHSHPNSAISGVLYFGELASKTPAIKFHNSTISINRGSLEPRKVLDRRELKYAQETFSIEFEPGLLVLFPSHLYHSVPVNNSEKVRCSLAFNSVPTRGLGDEGSLTELLF